MRIRNQWLYRQNFLLPTLLPRLIPMYSEICRVNTSRNSQNFLNKRKRPKSAPMLVSRRILTTDNDMKIIMSRVHFTPKWGNILRDSANLWKHEVRPSPGIKDVTVLRSWSNLYFETTVSWFRIVNGRSVGNLSRRLKPRPTPTLTLSLLSIRYHERKWIDMEGCFEVSKFMIRLLRHDDKVHRDDDGAVIFERLGRKVQGKVCWYFAIVKWSLNNSLGKRRTEKKRFQFCLSPNSSKHVQYFRAI